MFGYAPYMYRAGEHPASDQEYFALLSRAVFSAGLGPRVVEHRWPTIMAAFFDFDIEKVAVMDEGDVVRLLSDPGVIRNRRKIQAVIENARLFRDYWVARFGAHLPQAVASYGFANVAAVLSGQFAFLGRTSAEMFLWSCGFRPES